MIKEGRVHCDECGAHVPEREGQLFGDKVLCNECDRLIVRTVRSRPFWRASPTYNAGTLFLGISIVGVLVNLGLAARGGGTTAQLNFIGWIVVLLVSLIVRRITA